MISWKCSNEEADAIGRIVTRYEKIIGVKMDRQTTVMDLMAVNANGTLMDFKRMEEAPDFDLCHDIEGINRHLDRSTGRLPGFFLPRCAKPKNAWEVGDGE